MEVKGERRKKKKNSSGEAAAVKKGHKKETVQIFFARKPTHSTPSSLKPLQSFLKNRFCPYEPAESHFGSN